VQNVPKGTRDCTSKLDNDCDGMPDSLSSTCVCPAGNSQACTVPGQQGVCAASTQQCVLSPDKSSTAWQPAVCTQTNKAVTETCNGLDDDCNGKIDDVPATVCDVNGLKVGACAGGGTITGCNGTTPVCSPPVTPAGVGQVSPVIWHSGNAPNGSGDWDCDGAITLSFPADEFASCTGRRVCGGTYRSVVPAGPTPKCGDTFSGQLSTCSISIVSGFCVPNSGTAYGPFTETCH
jgi:hypothetical protein